MIWLVLIAGGAAIAAVYYVVVAVLHAVAWLVLTLREDDR